MIRRLLLMIAYAFLSPSVALAEPILIINGRSTLTESPFTTDSVTSQLIAYHLLVGNNVTIADAVPTALAEYTQIWDVRYSTAISGAEQSRFLSYLAGGGDMVVVGENAFYGSRNDSVLAFIAAAGGGTLSYTQPLGIQSVRPPFQGPDSVLNIAFSASGGVIDTGTGEWITRVSDDGPGTGVLWSPGDLVNALDGTLLAVFDVDFLAGYAGAREQALAFNLVHYLSAEEATDVPEPAPLALFGLGLCALGLARRRLGRA